MKKIVGMIMLMMLFFTAGIQAQKDDQRMTRDVEVAKNILSTLIKQQFDKRGYFPMSVEGDYVAGYGATFRVRVYAEPYGINFASTTMTNGFTFSGNPGSIEVTRFGQDSDLPTIEIKKTNPKVNENTSDSGVRAAKTIESASDSIRAAYNNYVIEASKNFITDYGDLISEMSPAEKIVVTNQDDGQRYVNLSKAKHSYISVEATKEDINLLRQGKMTREQFVNKVKVVNSESVTDADPDLELFSSILSRLYQQDLSRTYFADRFTLNYERLKDFGVIYYMQMRSSTQTSPNLHAMPTLKLKDIDKQTRDTKVIQLYPDFEKELKDYIMDYGRTLKSLKDEESLMLSIKLTECRGCGIPATLELSLKESVLKDFNSGKLTKEAAIAKINVKRSANQ